MVSTGGKAYDAVKASDLTIDTGKAITILPQFVGKDSDNDGIPDLVETYGLKPDGTPINSDPNSEDTDGDGLSDNEELGFVPFDAVLHASGEYLQHISYRSDPNNPDTDGEGLDDYEELLAGTEPQNIDTDKDCLDDSVEITQLYDALNPNPDGDNYNDYQEYTNGTDPYDYNMTIDEWITGFKSGVLQGDFIEDPSVPELLGQIVAGVAPKVGTIADVRDVIANVSQRHWIIAIMSAVGVVPAAGDLLKSSSKVADFIARNVDKTDEITELIVTLSKSFPDDFAKLIPNSSLDEIVQAFKSSNTMSRKTYDEIVALFQKARKRLPTLADDFNITGKIPSGTKVWNGTNHRQRGIEIDKLLGNNLGANYKTYDKLDEATLVATSIKSIDPMCTTYRTAVDLEVY